MIKQSPKRDPKFHQMERFAGAGRSISDELITFNTGWVFRIGLNISVFKGLLWSLEGPKRASPPVRNLDNYY